MMRTLRFVDCRLLVVLVLVGVGALLGATPARANYAPQAQVSGQVTSVNGQTAVSVDGQTYLIALDSPAYQTVLKVHVGDTIGLLFDGPPTASTSHVIFILTNSASGGGSSGSSSAASQ